jgi:hypothetical protein
MNSSLAFSIAVTFLLPWSASAQTAPAEVPAVTEPQYINAFYALGAKGELVDLEHQIAAFKSHTKVLPGYATIKMAAEFKPAHAPVHVSGNVQFVVRGRIPIDPASRFELRPLKASKDHREIVITTGHGSIIGGSATSTFDEGALPLKFEEYGVNSYRITPAQPLAPGEYAIGMHGFVTELYCFGVTP